MVGSVSPDGTRHRLHDMSNVPHIFLQFFTQYCLIIQHVSLLWQWLSFVITAPSGGQTNTLQHVSQTPRMERCHWPLRHRGGFQYCPGLSQGRPRKGRQFQTASSVDDRCLRSPDQLVFFCPQSEAQVWSHQERRTQGESVSSSEVTVFRQVTWLWYAWSLAM